MRRALSYGAMSTQLEAPAGAADDDVRVVDEHERRQRLAGRDLLDEVAAPRVPQRQDRGAVGDREQLAVW